MELFENENEPYAATTDARNDGRDGLKGIATKIAPETNQSTLPSVFAAIVLAHSTIIRANTQHKDRTLTAV